VALTPAEAIDTAASVFGEHPGFRALHARGVICQGSFTPTAEAASLSRAAHLAGPEVRVTVRFSNGAGNPEHPDWAPDPRGLAVKFYLPDGSRTDIVAVSSPLFPTRTPEGFLELLRAQAAGAAAVWKFPLFLRHHPEALRVLPRVAPSLAPPAGYDRIPYYGLHAFRWLDGTGGSRFVRYELRPAAGVSRLTPWAARGRARDYLQTGILAQLASGPVVFSVRVQIADAGDPVDDPSAAWPRSRRRVIVGTLSVTGPDTERDRGEDVLVFDPSRVTDGIECSEDPVLAFRPRAYSESVRWRMEAR
jgi:catalase